MRRFRVAVRHLKCRKARSWVTDSTQSSGWNLYGSQYNNVTHRQDLGKQRAECTEECRSRSKPAIPTISSLILPTRFVRRERTLCDWPTTAPPRSYPRRVIKGKFWQHGSTVPSDGTKDRRAGRFSLGPSGRSREKETEGVHGGSHCFGGEHEHPCAMGSGRGPPHVHTGRVPF